MIKGIEVGDVVLCTWYDCEKIMFECRVVEVLKNPRRLKVVPIAGTGEATIDQKRVRSVTLPVACENAMLRCTAVERKAARG